MWLSAFCSLHHDRSRRAYYARERSEGKLHNAAIMCLARRRCDVIHAHAPLRPHLRRTARAGKTAPQPQIALAA
jgi:hypothetical protein